MQFRHIGNYNRVADPIIHRKIHCRLRAQLGGRLIPLQAACSRKAGAQLLACHAPRVPIQRDLHTIIARGFAKWLAI